ncbi:MAG: prephenate dehydrogenase dimerization domain-containing protein, partial [Chloroflexota bacterium]
MIGQVVARYYQELGYQPVIADPKAPDSLTVDALLDRCKLLYITVFPLELVPNILEQIANRPDAADFVILENSSIKDMLKDAFQRLDQMGASLCATHPLCKADQPWKNQNVLMIPYGENSAAAEALALSLYQQAEMNIHQISSLEEHDELMCLLQLVPHLILRIVSTLFADLDADLQLLSSAATANFKLFYLSLWRVLVQSPDLSASIIGRLLQQPAGVDIYARLVKRLSSVYDQDVEELTTLFTRFYEETQPSDYYRERMNQQGIITLERLANLEQRSLSILTEKDEVGMLRKILKPFEDLGINITAIDSHLFGKTLRFDIGYDAGVTEEGLQQLEAEINKMGHRLVRA